MRSRIRAHNVLLLSDNIELEMAVLVFNANKVRIGDYFTDPDEAISISDHEFKFSIKGYVRKSFNVPMSDISKCLTHFGVKQQTNFQYYKHLIHSQWDVICLEVTEKCAKMILRELNAALDSVHAGETRSF